MAISQHDINSILSMITVRLSESNFVKWSYQFRSVLEGNDLFGFFDGSHTCPYKYVTSENGEVSTSISERYKAWKKC